MKKLSRVQQATISDLVGRLNDAGNELDEAIGKINSQIEAYNQIVAEAADLRDGIVADMEGYMGERSEKWAEGDAGGAYQDWKNEWEDLDFDEVGVICDLTLEHADHLESASTEPGGL